MGHLLTTWTVQPSSAHAEDARLATAFIEGRSHLVRHANPAFCELVGRSRGAIIGVPLDPLLGSDERGIVRGLLRRVFETGVPAVVSDVELTDPSGHGPARYITAIASPLVNED